MRKILLLLIGSFLSFVSSVGSVFAQFPIDDGIRPAMYGPVILKESTLLEKITAVIFSPIFAFLVLNLAIIAGVVVFVKKRRK